MTDLTRSAVLPLEGKRHVLLAVSGGGDSTALLVLAARQIKALSNPPKLTAITIDHGLRSESASEAEMVGALCARLGVDHIARRWTGEKPKTGIQDAARDARRVLIAETAGKIGADLVMTGHTLDDQRETVTMRARRGGGHGLAGIAPASLVFNDVGNGQAVWFCRPLLQETRQGLRDFLTSAGVGWIDDPSNNNFGFERIVMRHRLAELTPLALGAIDQRQRDAARLRYSLADQAAPMIKKFAANINPGLVFLDGAFFDPPQTDVGVLVLRVLLSFAAGAPYLADELHAKVLFDAAVKHSTVRGAKAERLGAGGVLADIRANGVYLLQERRRGSVNTKAFAGRYRLLGEAAAAAPAQALTGQKPSAPASLVRHAQLSEPMFDCPEEGGLSAAEAVRRGCRLRLLLNPWPDLVPSFDLTLANRLAELAGIERLPALAATLSRKL